MNYYKYLTLFFYWDYHFVAIGIQITRHIKTVYLFTSFRFVWLTNDKPFKTYRSFNISIVFYLKKGSSASLTEIDWEEPVSKTLLKSIQEFDSGHTLAQTNMYFVCQ